MIEHDAHVRIALRGLEHGGVECGAPDRVDVIFWVPVVRREMQVAGFVMDHPATHWDSVPQYFIGDAELLKRMNPARRKRQVDRSSADEIARARVGPSLVQIDPVSASSQ